MTNAPFNAPHPTRNNKKKEEETHRILTNANTTLKELREEKPSKRQTFKHGSEKRHKREAPKAKLQPTAETSYKRKLQPSKNKLTRSNEPPSQDALHSLPKNIQKRKPTDSTYF